MSAIEKKTTDAAYIDPVASNKLQKGIDKAIQEVPLYCALYKGKPFEFHPSNRDAVPYISKPEIVTGFPYNFLTDDFSRAVKSEDLEYTTTSGTTSDRMQIARKRRWWNDEYERTSHYNNYLRRHIVDGGRKAILTTAICSSAVCHLHCATFEERIVNATLYLNATADPYTWSKRDIERILTEIECYKPTHIDADAIYLAIFFKKVSEFGLQLGSWRPTFLTLSYEFIPYSCRRIIDAHWSVPAFNLYGSTEAGYLLCECEQGNTHSLEDLSLLEFLPLEGRPDISEVCVTSIKNSYMPLLRYQIGDLVSLRPSAAERCCCGANGTVKVARLHGRKKDAFINQDGALITVGDLDEVMGETPDLLLYQLDLSVPSLGARLRYVTFSGDPLAPTELDGIRDRVGRLIRVDPAGSKDLPVLLEHAVSIPPESSGKFALVKHDTGLRRQ